MSLSPNTPDRWNAAFSRVAVRIEHAAKHSTVVYVSREARTILKACEIPLDEASLKTVVDRIVAVAAAKGVPVQLGD
jgi:predicted ATP-grasp superfamily ATP-dependent carboligase